MAFGPMACYISNRPVRVPCYLFPPTPRPRDPEFKMVASVDTALLLGHYPAPTLSTLLRLTQPTSNCNDKFPNHNTVESFLLQIAMNLKGGKMERARGRTPTSPFSFHLPTHQIGEPKKVERLSGPSNLKSKLISQSINLFGLEKGLSPCTECRPPTSPPSLLAQQGGKSQGKMTRIPCSFHLVSPRRWKESRELPGILTLSTFSFNHCHFCRTFAKFANSN